MLILPPQKCQLEFPTNIGSIYGIDALTGEIPTVADITSRLTPLRRSAVLAWLCWMSSVVSDSDNKRVPVQLQLSAQFLPKELHDRYQKRVTDERNDAGGPGTLFHLQQIWFMTQMTMICCKEDAEEIPDQKLKETLATACLMANSILHLIETRIRSETPEPGAYDEWAIGTFLPLQEVYSQDEMLPTAHNIWFECAKNDNVRKKAIEHKLEPDIEVAFVKEHGLELKEFFRFLISLRLGFRWNHQISSGASPRLLDVADSTIQIFDAAFATKALTLLAQKPEVFAIELLASRQSWAIDMAPFRDKPVIQVFEDKLCCPDISFLLRTVIDKIFWLLEQAYPKGAFRTLFGTIFEEYVARLVSEFAPSSAVLAKVFYKAPRFEKSQSEAGDMILHFNDVAVVMELKANKLTNRQKYGGSAEELVQAIKDMLASKSKKKGA